MKEQPWSPGRRNLSSRGGPPCCARRRARAAGALMQEPSCTLALVGRATGLGRPGRRGQPPALPPSRHPGAPRACSPPAGTRAPPARASPAVTPEPDAAACWGALRAGSGGRRRRGRSAGARRRTPAWPACFRSQWLRTLPCGQHCAPLRRAQREHGRPGTSMHATRREHSAICHSAPAYAGTQARAAPGAARPARTPAAAAPAPAAAQVRLPTLPYTLLPSRVARCWTQAGTAGEPGRLPALAPSVAQVKRPGAPV